MKILITVFLLTLSTVAVNATVLSPEGIKLDYLDDKVFHSKEIKVSPTGENLKTTIRTNYPGHVSNIDYNIADLNVKSTTTNLAVKLNTGMVITNPKWKTSELLSDVVVYGRNLDDSFIPVQAIGHGSEYVNVSWSKTPDNDYKIIILIPFKLLDRYQISGIVTVSWATALCANSLVTTTFYYVPKPNAPTGVPTLLPYYPNITGGPRIPLPPTVLLFGSGLFVLFFMRKF